MTAPAYCYLQKKYLAYAEYLNVVGIIYVHKARHRLRFALPVQYDGSGLILRSGLSLDVPDWKSFLSFRGVSDERAVL